MPIRRALVSVSDKTGVVEFARRLAAAGVEIVSTGGTAKLLREAGVAVRDVAELTGWPEMLGGRVKTLHPKIHGGILFRRGHAEDEHVVREHHIPPIDLVAVNLYPFEAVAAQPDTAPDALLENIDIGGPAMMRSAAKNFPHVVVVCDPADYDRVASEVETGDVRLATRLDLARKVFATTARYDGIIATELERLADTGERLSLSSPAPLPERFHLPLQRREILRYGENPHQQAALYTFAGAEPVGVAGARQLQGKELSYNNLVDLDAAWNLVREFTRPAAVIIKHTNPCGAAEHDSQADAYRWALACDPVSAFGGVMAFNRPLAADTAAEISKLFVECIIAPSYTPEALQTLAAKKNLRLLEIVSAEEPALVELKRISGGVLVQTPDHRPLQESDLRVVTERPPTPAERRALLFAWKVCKHVKSNAIVFAGDGRTLGVGAGQMSRVDSVKIAVMKAQAAGLSLQGSVVASDAFFPFPDGVEEAARAGATAVIQPGGSVRDNEVIAAANRLGLAMLFTGIRHFKH